VIATARYRRTTGRAGSPVGRYLWRTYCAPDLFRFLAFGGTAALANLLAGWLLYGAQILPGLPYWGATAAAAAIGLVVNFALNYSFNFTFRERPAIHQFQTFCAIAGLGILLTSAISSGLLALFEGWLGHALALGNLTIRMDFGAHFMAVGLVALYSFPAHKAISFNVGIRARLRQLRACVSGAK
jgi:putative flippase GtrA